MQLLKKVIDQARTEKPRITSEDLVNIVREYLQTIILKSIYQSKFGQGLSFMGGTCLRICYDLKRYSEDLYFALDKKITGYDFPNLNHRIQNDLSLRNIDADFKASQDKTIQKTFIKIKNLLELLSLSRIKNQKLHIKIEVDTNPVDIRYGTRETFFISKYNEIFPILKHDLATLFAGKILAILCRPYRRGRDFYDLIWYLNRRSKINFDYLNEGLRQANCPNSFSKEEEVFKALSIIIDQIKPDFILKDFGQFLEDPSEEVWINRYGDVFSQLISSRS
jgi:predicted nucleotidyltransferase component of viral defense system